MPAHSSQPLRKPRTALSRGKFRWHLSLVLLGSAWLVVVVISLIAVSGLLSPNLSSNKPPQGTAAVRSTPSEVTRASQSHLPLWLFGAIALSCAAGSMLISSQANRPPRSRKNAKPKRLAPYAASEAAPLFPTAAPTTVETALQSLALVSQAPQPAPVAAPFMAPTTLMQLAQQVSQTAKQAADLPTAIVPEDKKPLDWGEASLADRLDIRKPRSVSPLL
ncbi:MAG: hypothetical protein KME27_01105 [Lyngbya sp. HA4199-MV5]|jgi:hypothetical protein|nr:hypothetical protein [Lyngbya sp. HA4199-MV5]